VRGLRFAASGERGSNPRPRVLPYAADRNRSRKGPMNDPRSQQPATVPRGATHHGSGAEEAALGKLREGIDAIDRRILVELNRRAGLVKQVGDLKRQSREGVYQAARERDLVEALVAANPGPFPDASIAPVFREIISATRSLEVRLRVAFLGPAGTFSHLAARELFGSTADFVPVASIADVFAAVERGDADHGIVPVENTTEGVVTQTLDALLESPLSLSGESQLRISLHLLSRSGEIARVRRVASHPQPLAQCRGWLDRHLSAASRLEMPSTAAAAELARQHEDVAAIGSALLGELLELRTVAPSIEDRRDNTTRFLVLGGDAPRASGNDLTSVVYTVRKAEAGALHRLLDPFARHSVNLTSIQARPLKGTPWEYVFFFDVEGHRSDAHVEAALADAGRFANSHRVLGSFPRAAVPLRPRGTEASP
jgi:chorismate mutase / prephenate dehydratase